MRIIDKILGWEIKALEIDNNFYVEDEEYFYDEEKDRYYFDIFYCSPALIIKTYGGKVSVCRMEVEFEFKDKREALKIISEVPFDVRYLLEKYKKTKIRFYPFEVFSPEIYHGNNPIDVNNILDIKFLAECI